MWVILKFEKGNLKFIELKLIYVMYFFKLMICIYKFNMYLK